MPSFDFSLSKKKNSKRKTTKNNSGFEVILKDVKGIIWCDKNAKYSVDIDDGFMYSIDKSCFSCKGKSRIYRRNIAFKDRYVYIRTNDNYKECNPNHFLPFAPGCIVVGDLVKYNNTDTVFIIKKCWTEPDNAKSHEALMYYKKHINEINDIIRKNM